MDVVPEQQRAGRQVYHEYEPLGTVLAYDVPGTDRGNDLKFTKETSAFDSDARASLDYLAGHARCTGRLGVMGICLGGHLAFRAAMNRTCWRPPASTGYTRRYEPLLTGLRAMTALLVLRDKAIKPLLAAAQPLQPKRGAHNPKPIDLIYSTMPSKQP